jgi:hypothetical protein
MTYKTLVQVTLLIDGKFKLSTMTSEGRPHTKTGKMINATDYTTGYYGHNAYDVLKENFLKENKGSFILWESAEGNLNKSFIIVFVN